MRIPVYNRDGSQRDPLMINDELTFVSGRVSKGDKAYYKGCGSPYRAHHTTNPVQEFVIGKSPVWYSGYVVANPQWANKFGIFYQPYQPYFSDFIGSCGPKESNIIANSTEFERSGVIYLDCVKYDPENRQQYFVLDYPEGRESFIKGGSAESLAELIETMLSTGWNFPWDKTAIRDVTATGRVSDVADMFQSKGLIHRFGTVYGLLYSLRKLAPDKFAELMKSYGITCKTDQDIPATALFILDRYGIEVSPLLPRKANAPVYPYLISRLITGRNCAHVEHNSYGERVKQQYINRFAEAQNAAPRQAPHGLHEKKGLKRMAHA